MLNERIIATTKNALDSNQPLTYLDHHISRMMFGLFIVEGISSVIQTCTLPEVQTLFPAIAAAFTFLVASLLSEDSEKLSNAIDKALDDQKFYEEFVDEYLPNTMIRRFMNVFDVEDGLGLKGQTAHAFGNLVGAHILDHATIFQEEQPPIPPTEISDIVTVTLQTYGMPGYNKKKATELREDAENEMMSLLEVQRIDEGNWSLTELEVAAKTVGDIFGDTVDFELIYAFTAFQEYIQEVKQGIEHNPEVSVFQPVFDNEVAPRLEDIKLKVRLALLKIKTDHQNMH